MHEGGRGGASGACDTKFYAESNQGPRTILRKPSHYPLLVSSFNTSSSKERDYQRIWTDFLFYKVLLLHTSRKTAFRIPRKLEHTWMNFRLTESDIEPIGSRLLKWLK